MSSPAFDQRPQPLRTFLRRATQAIFVLAAVAFALGLLGRQWWALDLFSHFRVQYGYTLLLCALLLSFLRAARWAVLAWIAAVIVAWPVVLDQLPRNASANAAAQARPGFKVLTLNAWFRNQDVGRVAGYLAASGADVILVQEFDARRMRELIALLPAYPHAALAAAEDRNGAAILSRWPIEAARPLQLAAAPRHAQWALVRWHSSAVQVVGVHLPWPLGSRVAAQRDAELHALAQWMSTTTGLVVVGGDFNLSPWSPHFAAALEQARAHDALASQPALSTWPTQFAPLGIQIDHLWMSRDWQVTRARRGPNVGSDHYPVLVELQPTLRAPGAG